jgi:hypothetical protein
MVFSAELRPPEAYARVPGALYHLAQMMAYMLDASWVFVDMGPGCGPLFMNVIMTSHGFLMPCGIDQKAISFMKSLAAKVMTAPGCKLLGCMPTGTGFVASF